MPLRGVSRHASSWTYFCSTAARRDLSTLQPSKLTPDDFLDLSGRKQAIFDKTSIIYWPRNSRERVPFPAGTQGYFYYVPGPAHAPLAGEVRFRITRRTGVDAFAEGHDLRRAHRSEPWAISVAAILRDTATHRHLRDLLVADGAADAAMIAVARALVPPVIPTSTIVHSLGQPFLHNLASQRLGGDLRIADGNTIHPRLEIEPPLDRRKIGDKPFEDRIPYTGEAICAFEAITVDGRTALGVRVLEIVKPVQCRIADYDGWLPPPVAGELLRVGGGGVWAYHSHGANVKAASVRALLADAVARWSGVGRRRGVHHLRPSALTPADWMDLTHVGTICAPVAGGKALRIRYERAPRRALFPAGAAGFLYAHMPDAAHPAGAHLRFRLVDTPDPARFADGQDLRTPAGTVWERWLPGLVRGVAGAEIAAVLAADGVIAQDVLDAWHAEDAPRSMHAVAAPGAEPFPWDFGSHSQVVAFSRGPDVEHVRIRSPFQTRDVPLFRGTALVHLVASPTEEVYKMRIAKINEVSMVPGLAPQLLPAEGDVVSLAPRTSRRLWQIAQGGAGSDPTRGST